MTELQEPKGVSFFNVKSGDEHWLKLEPTIAAYINSSDMGINASRDQDFGWKLGEEWVKKVRDFRRNRPQMQMLAQELGGKKPTTVQILYFIYSEELRAYEEEMDENEAPFAAQYQKDIAEKKPQATPEVAAPLPPLTPPASKDVDEDDTPPAPATEPQTPAPKPQKPKTQN